jgi:hypothetical protein
MSSTIGQSDVAYGTSNSRTSAAGRSGMGVAALVLGILAVLTSWTVIGGVLLGLLAVVFGAIGRARVNRGEASNGGVALSGLVLGLIGVVLAVVLIAVGATFVSHHKKQINNLQACLNNATTQAQQNSCNQQFQNSVNGNN